MKTNKAFLVVVAVTSLTELRRRNFKAAFNSVDEFSTSRSVVPTDYSRAEI
jgi:hypothetical protein